jgi:peroxiredoxin
MNGAKYVVVPFLALVGTLALSGCTTEPSAVAGVITESEQLSPGQAAPDFPVVTTDGKETHFGDIRKPTTIVAFVSPTGDQCCGLDSRLVSLAQELENRRVGVVQISEPTAKCPHGPGCAAACDIEDPHLISLCDAERRAWEAYREPQPNTAILINDRGEVVQVASLAQLEAVARKARKLASDYEAWWQSAYED